MTGKRFLKAHNLQPSMSRCGNCRDNAVEENSFQLLKKAHLPRDRRYPQDARQDVSDYSKMFYHPKRSYSMIKRPSQMSKISVTIYAMRQFLLGAKVAWS